MRLISTLAALVMSAQLSFADNLNRQVTVANDTDF